MVVRKYSTVGIPLILTVIVAVFDIRVIENQFINLLAIALFLQTIAFHFIYSEQIAEYSENLADKFIPQALQSRFGPIFTTLTIYFSTYVLGFIVVLLLFSDGWDLSKPSIQFPTIVLCIFIAGSILSPIVQSIFDADNVGGAIEITSTGVVYFVMIAFALIGLKSLDETLGDYVGITENFKILYLTCALLFAKANYVIDRAFNQGTIMHIFIFIALPVMYVLANEYKILAEFF